MAQTGSIERQLLLKRAIESERRSRRIGLANLKVTEMSECSLAQIETALHHGPAQHVTFALLKLGSLTDLAAKLGTFASSDTNEVQNDMEAIRQALNDTLLQIRNFASRRLPSNIAELSLGEIVRSVGRRHELRSGIPVQVENTGLPDQSPLSLKVCLYRIALEGLKCVSDGDQTQPRAVRVSLVDDLIRLEIAGSGLPDRPEITSLRNRVEAAGGTLHVDPSADGHLLLSTTLMISDMEHANA
jgi:signal transduction histidine kinase